MEKTCGRRYFLKIKPKESFSNKSNAYFGQMAVFEWLQTKNIGVSLSDIYKNEYEKEFDDFCKAQAQKEQELKQAVVSKFGYLKEIYPKFFKQLAETFSETNQIEKGKTAAEIQHKEAELGVRFSEELKTFFQYISVLKLEGVEIRFDALEKQTLNEKVFLILGEFWKYADGDKLFYDVENHNIVICAHEYQPPKQLKQADTMTTFVEKILFQYLKQQYKK
ncbi:SMI1/KNR4 family protein [Wielerella bovis]|uniref:SMI1/KNR4 family protein n=1 Tax=Wielerella bovis TaxID=2917790 RepID=UPI0020198F5C|nr:SMI1/KNR4 family protein [Wielerella bovis]ULJ63871.1 SMI1/KNR4 family protein [Wielerella bovis]